jgi:hypothetical protein
MSNEQKPETPCPCCGATDFIPGEAGAFGGLFFWPSPRRLFGRGAELLTASKCNACGHVQLFGKSHDDPYAGVGRHRWKILLALAVIALLAALLLPAMRGARNADAGHEGQPHDHP